MQTGSENARGGRLGSDSRTSCLPVGMLVVRAPLAGDPSNDSARLGGYSAKVVPAIDDDPGPDAGGAPSPPGFPSPRPPSLGWTGSRRGLQKWTSQNTFAACLASGGGRSFSAWIRDVRERT